eukprot:scaffold443702_cov19-Prasinocladus_malaysianus.AAC.1
MKALRLVYLAFCFCRETYHSYIDSVSGIAIALLPVNLVVCRIQKPSSLHGDEVTNRARRPSA